MHNPDSGLVDPPLVAMKRADRPINENCPTGVSTMTLQPPAILDISPASHRLVDRHGSGISESARSHVLSVQRSCPVFVAFCFSRDAHYCNFDREPTTLQNAPVLWHVPTEADFRAKDFDVDCILICKMQSHAVGTWLYAPRMCTAADVYICAHTIWLKYAPIELLSQQLKQTTAEVIPRKTPLL
jgi:hypothetical protein